MLVIIGILLAGGAVIGLAGLEAKRVNLTVERMDRIHKALLGYTIAMGRLPCPANLTITSGTANYGVEAASNSNTCVGGTPAANFSSSGGAAEGGVPTQTLQLPDELMYDAWGRRFRYAVNPAKTASSSFPPASGTQCPGNGALTVNDAAGSNRTTQGVYVLVSHGANGHGGYTRSGAVFNAGSTNTDEQTNCHCNSSGTAGTYSATYVAKLPTASSSTATDKFDDIVSFRDAWQLQSPNVAMANNACGAIYVADTGNNRIQKFDLSGNYVSQWGSYGSSDGQFNFPTCLAADSSGNVYVYDSDNHRVQKFDANGTWLLNIGGPGWGSGNGQLITNAYGYAHCGLAVDASGYVYVADHGNYRVQKFDSNGNYVTQWGTYGTGNGQFDSPRGIGIDSSGNVYVADYDNDRVQKFSNTGTYISKFSTNGGNNPWGSVAVDSSGNIYVSFSSSWQIDKYNSSGTYQSNFCPYGTGNGQCMAPPLFAMDSSGNFWVADGDNSRVQKFDSSLSYVSKFGSAGTGNGQFDSPSGIVVTSR
ncbi:MAG: hypothetical protein KIT17_01040 [Rubrivivax sp.]|nr:hypothetical protein [Rubrivivax sp.]